MKLEKRNQYTYILDSTDKDGNKTILRTVYNYEYLDGGLTCIRNEKYIRIDSVQPFYKDISHGVEPKNNDGRKKCFWCSAETKTVSGILNNYQICDCCGR